MIFVNTFSGLLYPFLLALVNSSWVKGIIEDNKGSFNHMLQDAMMIVKHYGRGSGSGATTLGKPFVHPATVGLRGKVYELLRQNATRFLLDDVYRNPGPLQFEGPGADSKAVKAFVW